MRERRIANRENRPSRILGCTWGEWGTMATGIIILMMSGPPFLFGFVAAGLIVSVTLLVHRRFPPGAINDWLDTQGEILLRGHQRAGPATSDRALRAGGLSPLDDVES